jgi:hypothetical protein
LADALQGVIVIRILGRDETEIFPTIEDATKSGWVID